MQSFNQDSAIINWNYFYENSFNNLRKLKPKLLNYYGTLSNTLVIPVWWEKFVAFAKLEKKIFKKITAFLCILCSLLFCSISGSSFPIENVKEYYFSYFIHANIMQFLYSLFSMTRGHKLFTVVPLMATLQSKMIWHIQRLIWWILVLNAACDWLLEDTCAPTRILFLKYVFFFF